MSCIRTVCGCLFAVGVLAAGCAGEDPAEDAASDGSGDSASGDGAAEAGEGGGEESGGEAVPGPVTFALAGGEILTERRCDFDGDGVGDNAVADLGPVESTLFATYMSARIAEFLSAERPLLLHLPWVADARSLTDPETVAFILEGRAVSWGDDVPTSPEGPFFADASYLDSCGEPSFPSLAASLDHGAFDWGGDAFPIPIGLGPSPGRGARVTGELAPDGASARLEACLYVPIADLGVGSIFFDGAEWTPLEVLVGGGRAVGIPTLGGLQPDVDLDGDGLESFVLDEEGVVSSCVDGDYAVIDGADCWLDPRMADGFSFSFTMEGVGASFAGRRPGWERWVGGGCPEGPPSPSRFESPAGDSAACAGFEEVCEPFAPQPCCDPDLVCTGMNRADHRCFALGCDPPLCDYGGEPGICESHGGADACYPLWRLADRTVDCEPADAECATEYGAIADTFCHEWASYSSGWMLRECLQRCTRPPSGCEPGYVCQPLRFTDDAVCVRQVADE